MPQAKTFLKSKPDEEEALRTRFIQAALKLQEHCHKFGCGHIKVSFFDELPYFSLLDRSRQASVITSIERYNRVCESTLASGEVPSNSKKFVWFGLKQLGFKFDSDLFELIDSDDTIEVYGPDGVQLFRNFSFMEKVSYSIEDLYCRPWMELFRRLDETNTEESLKICEMIFTGQTRKPVSAKHMGTHRIVESQSPMNYKIDLLVKYIAPLFGEDGQPAAIICIERGENISPKYTDSEREQRYREHLLQAGNLRPDLDLV